MRPWEKAIHGYVKDAALAIADQLRKNYGDEIQVSKNYQVRFPAGMRAGQKNRIPVTLPSNRGPLEVGEVVVDVSPDWEIMDLDIDPAESIRVYSPSQEEIQHEKSATKVFDQLNEFFDNINEVFTSDPVKTLVTPKVGRNRSAGIDLDGGSRERVISGRKGNNGATGMRIRSRQSKNKTWKSIRAKQVSEEMTRADKISSDEDRLEFLGEALRSPSRAPAWFYNLGGKVKKNMRKKLERAYLQVCEDQQKTVPPTAFLEQATRSMAEKETVLPYCEHRSEGIEGTTTGECRQTNCPIYSPTCKHFSYRLNSENYS